MSRRGYVFDAGFTSVAAAILAAVEGGILPPGPAVHNGSVFSNQSPIPPGRLPGSTAGKMPAATLNTYRRRAARVEAGFEVCLPRRPSHAVCRLRGFPVDLD